MFKKELADVLKQTAIFLPAVALIPAVILALHLVKRMSYLAVLLPVFQTALLFWALFLGASLLMRERDQHAVEYALSMPYSRLQLAGLKIMPRAAVLAALYVVFLLLYRANGSSFAAMGLEPFTITLVLLFVISVSLAPITENFLVLTLMTMFAAAACWVAVLTIVWLINSSINPEFTWTAHFRGVFTLSWLESEEWLGPFLWANGLIILVPFVLAFLKTAGKFDVRPAAHHGRRFASLFVPAALAAVGASFILANAAVPRLASYFDLSQDRTLLEYRRSMFIAYEEDHRTIFEFKVPIQPWTAFAKGKFVYFRDALESHKKLDLESGVVTDLPPNGQDLWGRMRLQDGGDFDDIKPRSAATEDISLIKRNVAPGEAREIVFRDPLFQKGHPRLLGGNTFEGRSYWLASLVTRSGKTFNRYLLRLWEDGRVESRFIEAGGRYPIYFNRLLFLRDRENVTIFRDTGTAFEAVKTILCDWDSSFFGFLTYPPHADSAPPFHPKAYYISRGRVMRLDLETLETEDVAPVKAGTRNSIISNSSFGFFMEEEDPALKTITLYRIEDRRLAPIRAFSLTYDREAIIPGEKTPFIEWKEHFIYADAGLILQKGKKIRVFAWPDLRELKFKGL